MTIKKTLSFTSFLLISLLSQSVSAITLSGIGYGSSQHKAKIEALASLSESLMVEVRSEFQYQRDENGNLTGNKSITSFTELPLLGVKYSFQKTDKEIVCRTTIDSAIVNQLYYNRLQLLAKSINQLSAQLSDADQILQYQILKSLLVKVEQLNKLNIVADLLNVKVLSTISINLTFIKNQLLTIESSAPNLAIAAKILVKDLPLDKAIFIYAATPAASNQTTEFSRLVRDKIAQQIKTVDNPNNAEYFLKGQYEILKNNIVLTYRLTTINGEIDKTNMVKLSSSAYADMDYQPKTIDFEALLNQGYVISNNFRAELSSNLGKEALLFTNGQRISLFAKLNHAGYFYIISYNAQKEISYLLQLSHTKGTRKFVRYVNADDVNHWLNIGEFEVSPPYGVENLQLIASRQDLIDRLPVHQYNSQAQLYYLKQQSVFNAVKNVRQLNPSQKTSEVTLTLTTMP